MKIGWRGIKDMTLNERLKGAAEEFAESIDGSLGDKQQASEDFIEGAKWMREAMENEADELVQ